MCNIECDRLTHVCHTEYTVAGKKRDLRLSKIKFLHMHFDLTYNAHLTNSFQVFSTIIPVVPNKTKLAEFDFYLNGVYLKCWVTDGHSLELQPKLVCCEECS